MNKLLLIQSYVLFAFQPLSDTVSPDLLKVGTSGAATFQAIQSQPQRDYITINQPNGSRLNVVPMGNEFVNYVETLDGYSLVKNKIGVFEYAVLQRDGSFKASGILANDITRRSHKELIFLVKHDKHLRYSKEYIDQRILSTIK